MNNKRSSLKKISGVTVAAWTAPVVGSLVLPVHAQASLVAPTTTPLPEDRGEPLLHFSSITPNPVNADCGPDGRELVAITNSGTAELAIDGFIIVRVTIGGLETIFTLSGVIDAGETLSLDVCDGNVAGTSAVLNNQFGGFLRLLDANADVVDLVRYPSILNGPDEGTAVDYGPTPSTTTPRTS